ncbi:MAG: sugar ABC transporter permease [Thermogemmatispora sp.]|uniref:carbohydrate ABC transporter permease n=1 Tax=Thermogemmatispora sp. TaxID=1968838 RepID=UPI00262B990C|nr:sugar ABC transporter permease [Thermogemmatispora sp.]MBX5458672.1 sugar ABC transporter permease [Thermogemmatispora sp.]
MEQILRNRRAIVLLVGPALLVYSGVVLLPIVWSLVYTFFEGNVIGGFHFVGLQNYRQLLSDAAFWQALVFTLKYAVTVTAGQILLGLLLALLYVFYLRRASALVRTLVFFPVVLPTVAVAQLFAKIFAIAPQYGLVNAGLALLHLDGWIQAWLGQGSTAFWVLALMDIWRAMGFYAVLLYAGLVEIPAELIEAARVDGASGLRLVWHVILPLLLPILLSALIFSINGTLKVFDSILALTGGGPGQATTPLTLYMFNTAFSYGQYGYGSTLAMALAVLSLIVTIMIFGSARRDVA